MHEELFLLRKKLALFVLGFFCLNIANQIFVKFDILTKDIIVYTLVFKPFQLFGGIFMFIAGFLAMARLIKKIIEEFVIKDQKYQEIGWSVMIVLMFLFLGLESIWFALCGLGFSLFYGIMDANIAKNHKRYYQN